MVTRGTVPQRGYVISIDKIYNLPKLVWDAQFWKNKWIDLLDNDLEQYHHNRRPPNFSWHKFLSFIVHLSTPYSQNWTQHLSRT